MVMVIIIKLGNEQILLKGDSLQCDFQVCVPDGRTLSNFGGLCTDM